MRECRNSIYVDNAATSYPKPAEVVSGVQFALTAPMGNPGRGSHEMALDASKEVFGARELVGRFFGIQKPTNLAFTKNATEALNFAILGYLKEGDHVITTSMEHNSILRPLTYLEKLGVIRLSIVFGNKKGEIDPNEIEARINDRTKMIAVTFSSNVNGTKMPIESIGKIPKSNGLVFLLDAAQGAGVEEIDVDALNVDLMAFPGHKGLLGPQGTGGLYVREGISIVPTLFGGTGSVSESLIQPEFMPDMLESGTLNLPGIVGLKKGVEFLHRYGLKQMKAHKGSLIRKLVKGVEELKGYKIYSLPEPDKNSGILALELLDVESGELSHALDKLYNIKTRSGYHCAPLAHKTLGTFERGLVRISPGVFNTEQEMDCILDALKEISKSVS